MILTKVSAGHVSGPIGKTAHLTLVPRDGEATAKILGVVYGEDKIDHDDSTFDLKIVKGEQALAVVYGCTDTVFVDLSETDGTGTQKLRADKFNPEEPFLSIWVEGM